jgi:HD-GYP domain-containing protein (c-di-GMP phosphodiesterase class II)
MTARAPAILAGATALIAVAALVALAAGLSAAVAGLIAAAALLVVAAVALVGWRRAEGRAARADEVAAGARESQRTDRERLERHLRRVEAQRQRETQLVERLRRSWQAEREWNRELRGQIQHLHAQQGMFTRADDLHSLILGAAVKLVEAEKGMLVSRSDEDGDGELDVVRSEGFDNDPTHSAVAQRFARAVLARDEIVRDDSPPPPGETEATPADREIDSLVAIPVYLRDRFHGVIVCVNRSGGFEEVGDELLLALGDHAGAALQQGRLRHELEDAQRSAIRVLTEAVAADDPVLHRETGELAVHAGLLAQELEVGEPQRDVLVCATLLRAVGYLPLPDRVRLRPGALTPDERALIALHPRLGFNVLSQAPALRDVANAVLYHHERVDGSGYPAGLRGDEIPLASRVLAVLEAFGAMTHERPYRTPWTPEQACEALIEGAGSQFDAEIVQLFVEQVRRQPSIARDDVSGAVLDALPLAPGDADGAVPQGLLAAAVDGATLLGNHRRLQQDVSSAARRGRPFGVLVLALVDLPRVNAESGHVAGDRLIAQAARSARRAAARLGGTAYRESGRRMAIFVPAREGQLAPDILDEVRAEFLAGPTIRAAMAMWTPGEPGEAVLSRARDALKAELA